MEEFVNADVIAQGLSGFRPAGAAIEAGRIMLKRLRELTAARLNVAFKTTLASRSFAPWIGELVRSGYEFHLVFLWLPSAEVARARVLERVQRGGHAVPEETVRRRYEAGLKNFFQLYMALATTWRMFDNTEYGSPGLIASGRGTATDRVLDPGLWERIAGEWGYGGKR